MISWGEGIGRFSERGKSYFCDRHAEKVRKRDTLANFEVKRPVLSVNGSQKGSPKEKQRERWGT